jgi:hypothetical protein
VGAEKQHQAENHDQESHAAFLPSISRSASAIRNIALAHIPPRSYRSADGDIKPQTYRDTSAGSKSMSVSFQRA